MKSFEKATHSTILEWPAWKRVFHSRQNSGAFKTERGGFSSFGVKGCAGHLRHQKRHCNGIEGKDVNGRQNGNQRDFQGKLEAAGGHYTLAP